MESNMRRNFAALVAVIALTSSPHPAHAGNLIVAPSSPTWREEIDNCKILLYVRIEASRMQQDGDGETVFAIEHALKSDPVLGNVKRVTHPRYIEIKDPKNPGRMLLFGDVFKNKPDFYRGIAVGPSAVEYVKGILAVKDRPRREQLRFYFDHLEDAEAEIAADAYAEFRRETNTVLADAACRTPPEKLRAWLRNEKTAKDRLGLYALLLGHCGEPEDAALVRALLERFKKEPPPYHDELFKSYALLNPKEGWAYAHAVVRDPDEPFVRRYAVARAARFFLTEQKGAVAEKQLLDTFAALLEQGDIADIPVEYLRASGCRKLTKEILALAGKDTHKLPIIRRAILRYALQCTDPAAYKYVGDVAKADPEMYRDTLELLILEAASLPK
jgi:hypothetical protein